MFRTFAILFLLAVTIVDRTGAQPPPVGACPENPSWDEPAAPVKVFGNTWYVGTCGVSALLVTSDQGHVLVDGATEKAALLIAVNIRSLGFRLEDVRYIVNSHEHLDHAGGLAELQRLTGATVMARTPAIATLERGRSDPGDPQFHAIGGFAPVKPVKPIGDGKQIKVGSLALTAHATPGHTPGATSWTWTSCEAGRCLQMVYSDSLSAVSDGVYRYSDEAAHPGVLAAFRQSLDTVAGLPCDVLLTPHPAASRMFERLGPSPAVPLADTGACRTYAAGARERLEARVVREQAGTPK